MPNSSNINNISDEPLIPVSPELCKLPGIVDLDEFYHSQSAIKERVSDVNGKPEEVFSNSYTGQLNHSKIHYQPGTRLCFLFRVFVLDDGDSILYGDFRTGSIRGRNCGSV